MKCGDDWKLGPVFIPGTRCTGSGGTNGEREQWVGAVPISSHLHTSYPAFENGKDRWFRNVGMQKSEAEDTPKRLHIISKTRRKFEIKN
jgi:hypothetical protein